MWGEKDNIATPLVVLLLLLATVLKSQGSNLFCATHSDFFFFFFFFITFGKNSNLDTMPLEMQSARLTVL